MKEIKALYDRVAALEHIVHNSSRHGTVEDIDAKGHKIRIKFGGTDEKPFLSPWVPYSQIAGTRKVHSHPSKGQEVTLISPSGDWRQAIAVPLQWSDNNPAPSEDASTDIDLRGKTKRTQTDGNLKQEIDGVTRVYSKQNKSTIIYKDPETEKEGKDETVDDAHPWKGNRAKPLHSHSINKDGGLSIVINTGDDQKEHKITLNPDGTVTLSVFKAKHTFTINKDKIESSVSKGKHKITIDDSGITHTSETQVTIKAPNIKHDGDLKVTGSVLAQKVIQSSQGLLGPLIAGFPGNPGSARDF